MKFTYMPTTFNLDILVLNKQQLKQMYPVRKLNIFVPSSEDFEPHGLFSTEIFGQVGSEQRNSMLSYIGLNTAVFHPLIYNHLITSRALYKEVMAGTKYVKYDKETKDLVLSNQEEGDTGYTYFVNILPKIKFDTNDSDFREFKINMIKKYGIDEYMLKQLLVIPAGLRDYTVNKSGVPEEDEINDLYRKVLAISNTLANIRVTPDTLSATDKVRYRMQEALWNIYDHIMTLLDGKNKFIQGSWGKRGIIYGTRNVITPSLSRIKDLDKPDGSIGMDYTTVGLYQYSRCITPITMHNIHTKFISRILSPDTTSAYLINTKSMKSEMVNIPVKARDTWLTIDGLDDMLGALGQNDLRSEPIMLGKHYMMLIYDDGKNIRPVFNTDELDDSVNAKHLRPMTYYELLYLALLDTFDKYRGTMTRYPVIELGSIYPCKLFIKTTEKPRKVTVHMMGRDVAVDQYPNYKEAYYNSMSPHYTHLETLGADYDGDAMALNVVFTDDAIAEIDKVLNSKEYYVAPNGTLPYTPDTGPLEYTIAAMSKGARY